MQSHGGNTYCAVFSGTFSPIHMGHIKLAEAAAREMNISKVALMPTVNALYKRETATFVHREAMCRIAAENHPSLYVPENAARYCRSPYTIDMIERILEKDPNAHMLLVVGVDSFLSIGRWVSSQKILDVATICVGARNDSEEIAARLYASKSGVKSVLILSERTVDICSSAVRGALAEGRNCCEWLDAGVSEYIFKKRLYGAGNRSQ
ncbi:MAG: nicotinate (nicotinamide) nucleotide adenylyltransferase [Oscillospiraceae bacterium]